MDKYFVHFELLNGEKHKYDIDNTTEEQIYNKINNAPDGWIEFLVNGEKHYIKKDKIVRVRVINQAVAKQRIKNSVKGFNL